MSRLFYQGRSAKLERFGDFSAKRKTFAVALVLVMTSCSRRDEGSAPNPPASVMPQSTSIQVNTTNSAANALEPQPDFIKHPPLHLKPACASSSATAVNDGGNRCVTMTLRCTELDAEESVWLATTPAIAKMRLPEGAKGLRVTIDNEVSAKVCCNAPVAEKGPVKVQLRLFTNEVAGATQEIECP